MKRRFAGELSGRVLAVLVGLFAAVAVRASDREEVAPRLYVGDVLDQTNWELAKGLLPPEVLKHYEQGDYRNEIISYSLGSAKWEESFIAATERNAATLDVDEAGTIVEAATGKPPPYVYGIPFPNVDAGDPRAAVKIVWNQFLAYWSGGDTFNDTMVAMLVPSGMDREIRADGYFKFWEGQGPKYRQDNPLNLQSQFLGVSTFPADLQGTSSLTWRYRDARKRDSVWAFVPALRRVRAVSPANRSDGYLGSDISGDDGFHFDGKPEDFTWALVGKREAFRVVDPLAVAGKLTATRAPRGGWNVLTDPGAAMVGFQDPGWDGISWAPYLAALAKRPMWVVQARPKDPYYLYGKLELWIDAETWDGSWNRKFSWQGELIHAYQNIARINSPVGSEEDREYLFLGSTVWACGENFKMNRATCGGIPSGPQSPSVRRWSIPAHLFDAQSLQKYGK